MTPDDETAGAPIMTQPTPSSGATNEEGNHTDIPLGPTETTGLRVGDPGKDYTGVKSTGSES